MDIRPDAVFAIDPTSNQAAGLVELENHTGSAFCKLSLRAEKFVNQVTHQVLDSQVTFAPAQADTASSVYSVELAPKQRLLLKVALSGVWEAGESHAQLLLEGQPLAVLTARKLRVPFAVQVLNPGSDAEPLRVEYEEPWMVTLKNEDALTYPVSWQLVLNGEIQANDGCGASSPPLTLPPSSQVLVKLCPPKKLFPDSLSGLFKERVQRGVLTISHVATGTGTAAAPSKAVPLVVRLGRHGQAIRTTFCTLLTLIVLVLGGLCSLFLTYTIPNHTRRIALHTMLAPLAARTKELSEHVPARLRVELRVARLQISRRIDAESMFFPGAAEVLDTASRDALILSKRIELIGGIDDRMRRIDAMGSDGPPDLLQQQMRALLVCIRPLAAVTPTNAQLDAAAAGVAGVENILQLIEADDATLRANVLATATEFWAKCFEPAWNGLSAQQSWVPQLQKLVDGFVKQAALRFKSGQHAGESLASLDTIYAKLKLIAEYIQFCQSATERQATRFDEMGQADQDFQDRSQPSSAAPGAPTTTPYTQRDRFFDCLLGVGSRTLGQAQLVLRSAEQGIFVKQIEAQLDQGKFSIRVEPQYTRPYDPVEFRLVFMEDKFNDAAALEKIDCEWTFPHRSAPRVERCWTAFQFFGAAGEYAVSVQVRRGAKVFYPKNAAARPTMPKVVIHDQQAPRISERTRLELIQLAVALGVTMAALVTGARDQLERLDMAAAIAAIFAVGFGADVVKTIVSRTGSPNAQVAKA